jgi:TonB family protein
MAFGQARAAFDLLGQTEKSSAPVRLAVGEGPKLDVAWGSFRHSLWSSLRATFFEPGIPRKLRRAGYFKDCCVEGRVPLRAIVAAALWHIFFVIAPFPKLPAVAHKNPALEDIEASWSGPIEDLPLLEIPSAKAKRDAKAPSPAARDNESANAFHPRQHIFADPANPTHPRQTLINPAAPAEPPKILPNLPNIVQFQAPAAPARPRIEISAQTLEKLRPRERHAATVAADAPRPELSAVEQKTGDVPLALSPNAPARPKLELNAGAAPRLAQTTRRGDAGAAPEMNAAQQNSASASSGKAATLIALSAAPAPPGSNVQVPPGNLAARIAISPEGKPNAAPTDHGAGGATNGAGVSQGAGVSENTVGISISGGNPAPKGTSARISTPSPRALMARPEPRVASDDTPVRSGPPQFATLPPGAAPEQIFAEKKIYKLLVNMPNLNSATGSWVLNFSELRVNPDGPRITSADLAGPVPIRKIDPKYPPSLINEHVEGEVVLYAVIRQDGSIDSIQLVRGLDEQLDANAMSALSQWKFLPASKQGVPIDLEAIVHIPFHAPSNR